MENNINWKLIEELHEIEIDPMREFLVMETLKTIGLNKKIMLKKSDYIKYWEKVCNMEYMIENTINNNMELELMKSKGNNIINKYF